MWKVDFIIHSWHFDLWFYPLLVYQFIRYLFSPLKVFDQVWTVADEEDVDDGYDDEEDVYDDDEDDVDDDDEEDGDDDDDDDRNRDVVVIWG